MNTTRRWATVAALAVLGGCGGGDDEAPAPAAVERVVARHAGATAEVRRVTCRRLEAVWGCEVRFADGRTQACQASTAGGRVTGAACQPMRGE